MSETPGLAARVPQQCGIQRNDHRLRHKLFGSEAAGRGEPDSDIDVLVAVKVAGAAVEDQVLDVAFEVNVAHEVYISPRVIARATLEDPVWRLTPFLQAVEREGVPL